MNAKIQILCYAALLSLLTTVCGQLGPVEYCIDLEPQNNLTIQKLTGTWLGVEVIVHRDMISGEKSERDCTFVVITEISHIVSMGNTCIPAENFE